MKSKIGLKVYLSLTAILLSSPFYVVNAATHTFNNLQTLLNHVGYICYDPATGSSTLIMPTGINPGDIIKADPGTSINLDALSAMTSSCIGGMVPNLPLIIPSGVTLEGDYDLLSESYIDPSGATITTSPSGTLFYSDTYRSQYDTHISIPNPDSRSRMYFFAMAPGDYTHGGSGTTTIRNIRMRGASVNWTEFNNGYGSTPGGASVELYCGGIDISRPCKFNEPISNCGDYGFNYHITHCEISGFDIAGIWIEEFVDAITIDHCFIHNVKGSSFSGIGYGMWVAARLDALHYSFNDVDLTINNIIFDYHKDALDGTTSPFNTDFRNNTLTRFAGGINKHNNTGAGPFNHTGTGTACDFFDRQYPASSSQCISAMQNFDVSDYSPGNFNIGKSIFHAGQISIPYPGNVTTGPVYTSYNFAVLDNTFVAMHDPADAPGSCDPVVYGFNLRHGYCQIADNYIENCPWSYDQNIDYSSSPNSFDYKLNSMVGNTCPQPPEVYLDLLDAAAGSSLPTTFNTSITPGHNYVQYVNNGQDFKISIKHGNLGSQNQSYIIRKNPNSRMYSGNNTSGNNSLIDGEFISTPTTSDVITGSYHYKDYNANPLPGLYGIDVLGVAASSSSTPTWAQYNSSAWQHIPLIVVPPSGQEKYLIFNIKDSYQEYHNNLAFGCTTCPTGVYKQVELNGEPIWWEDIAEGGNDWERVAIDLAGNIPGSATPILNYLKTDGSNNTLTFSVAIRNSGAVIPTDKIRGLLVWVDDVYLKKNENADNLIADGDVERATGDGLPYASSASSTWYQKYNVAFQSCTALPNLIQPAPSENLYPDGSPVVYNAACNGPATQANFFHKVRKSGSQALMLKIPALLYSTCNDYNSVICTTGTNHPVGILISAATDIDFTDLLSCSDYTSPPFSFTTTLPASGIQTGVSYYLTSSCTLTSPNALTLKGCNVVCSTGVSITVEPGATLTIEDDGIGHSSHFFACSDMWQGINIKPGGRLYVFGTLQIPSLIEDAETAIYCDQQNNTTNLSTVVVRYAVFDHNYIDIHLLNGFFPFGHNVHETAIRAAQFRSTGGVLIKAGHTAEKTPYHILLENVYGTTPADPMQIGEDGYVDYKNYFSEGNHGIFAINSSLHAVNNQFADLGYLEEEEPGVLIAQGGGIFAKSDDANLNTIAVDDDGTGYPNKFIRCNTGILASGIVNLAIQNNNKDIREGGFESCPQAIAIYNAPKYSLTLANRNDISEYKDGLYFVDIDAYSQFQINSNWFNCDDAHAPRNYGETEFSTKAISIQNVLNQPLSGSVNDNIISNSRFGIHLRNIGNHTPGLLHIGDPSHIGFSNQVHYLNAPAPDASEHYFGYWFENCDNLEVDNDIALSNTVPLGAGIEKHFRGFSFDNTTNSNFCSNQAEKIGSGVWVYNKCAGTQFHGTTNTDCFHGFHLVNADLPRQGTGTEDWENNWPGAHTNDIIGTTANGILDWDYPNAGTSPCSDCDPTVNTGYVQKHGQNQHNQNCAPPNAPLVEQRDKEFGATVMDTIIYDGFPDENKYQDKEQFYKKGSDDSTFLALGVSNDIVYQNEFDSLAQTNVGKLKAVEDNLKNENFSAAASLNQTISPINQIEENKKQVVELQLSLNAHNDSMTSSEKVQWNLIADQDAIHGGEAVYIARARLNKDVVDDPIGYYRLAHQEATNTSVPVTTHGRMVPNPAREEVIYYYEIDKEKTGVLEIKDMTGRLLLEKKIEGQSNNISVSVSQFAPGIYFYRSFCDGAIVDESKLIIIK